MTTIAVKMDTIDLRGADNAPVGGRHVDNLQGLRRGTRDPSFDPGPIDGLGGRRTKDAVVAFQSATHLAADAIVGPLRKADPLLPDVVRPASGAATGARADVGHGLLHLPAGWRPVAARSAHPRRSGGGTRRAARRPRTELLGPSGAEGAAGFFSWFSGATAGMLHGVELEPGGRAVIDFADLVRSSRGPARAPGPTCCSASSTPRCSSSRAWRRSSTASTAAATPFFEWLRMECHDRTRPHRQPA